MRPRLSDPNLLSHLGTARGPHIFVVIHGPDCEACAHYVQSLKTSDGLGDWGARVTVVTGAAAPGLIITDEWGEIFFEKRNAQHEMPSPAEVEEWIRFVAIQCEECEQPEGEWRSL